MISNYLALANGLICAAVFMRIITYTRNGARYKAGMSALAAMLAFATGAEAFLCFMGLHCVSVSQLIINAGMAVALFAHKGNVSRCLPLPRHKREALKMVKFSRKVA